MTAKNTLWLCLCLLVLASPMNALATASEDEDKVEPVFTQTNSDSDERSGVFDAFGWAMAASSAADVASTEWGLRQPGVFERNPLMGNRSLRIGVHVATPAAVWWLTERMHRQGQKKVALIVRISVVAAYGYATLHNLRTLSSLKGR